MTLAEIREALDSVAGTAADLGTGVEGDARLETLATALENLTKCVQALTEHLDGQGKVMRSNPNLKKTWDKLLESGDMVGEAHPDMFR